MRGWGESGPPAEKGGGRRRGRRSRSPRRGNDWNVEQEGGGMPPPYDGAAKGSWSPMDMYLGKGAAPPAYDGSSKVKDPLEAYFGPGGMPSMSQFMSNPYYGVPPQSWGKGGKYPTKGGGKDNAKGKRKGKGGFGKDDDAPANAGDLDSELDAYFNRESKSQGNERSSGKGGKKGKDQPSEKDLDDALEKYMSGESKAPTEGPNRTNKKKSKTMKALSLSSYKDWSSQDLALTDVPVPVPSSGEVLVRLKAAAINPIDIKVVSGAFVGKWADPSPYTPGYDLSGTVVCLGEGVDDLELGDDVFAVNWALDKGQEIGQHDDNTGNGQGPIGGAFAEYCLMPANKLSQKHPSVSHVSAAAVALVGTTALQGLRIAKAEAGKRILVLGGSGAVGYIACQLGKLFGAHVSTTCSKRTWDYVKATGADHMIDYASEKWYELEEIKGLDAVFDTIGETDGLKNAKTVLKDGGVFISIASMDAGLDPKAHAPLSYAAWYCLKNNTADQDKLMAMIADGKLRVNVEKQFGFTKEGVTELFAAQASGKSQGKNVLVF